MDGWVDWMQTVCHSLLLIREACRLRASRSRPLPCLIMHLELFIHVLRSTYMRRKHCPIRSYLSCK